MKKVLRQLFLSTMDELSLGRVMPRKVHCQEGVLAVGEESIDLAKYKKNIVVAIGKAAFEMTASLAEIVQPHKVYGVTISSVPPSRHLPYFLTYQGGHPYPDEGSFHAADVVEELLTDLRPDHLVLFMLSGGGSAIFEQPVSNTISLKDVREFYHVLVTCGANIVEMNVLRKHFSAVKGGRLAERAHPARQVTLYISDVPVDKPSTVASGPTMPDESTVEDCYEIADRLGLLERFPKSIRTLFEERQIHETPKPDSEVFANSSWHCLLDNRDGLLHLEQVAVEQGWRVETDSSVDDWPLESAVEHLLRRLRELRSSQPGGTVAVLSGGELSCPVTGDGLGGRNQAFVLECAKRIGGENIAVVSAGTDGIDGNSSAAGAVADGSTLERAAKLGVDAADYQLRSDSNRFFEALDDLLVTGPTGNNIRDLRLLVAW